MTEDIKNSYLAPYTCQMLRHAVLGDCHWRRTHHHAQQPILLQETWSCEAFSKSSPCSYIKSKSASLIFTYWSPFCPPATLNESTPSSSQRQRRLFSIHKPNKPFKLVSPGLPIFHLLCNHLSSACHVLGVVPNAREQTANPRPCPPAHSQMMKRSKWADNCKRR